LVISDSIYRIFNKFLATGNDKFKSIKNNYMIMSTGIKTFLSILIILSCSPLVHADFIVTFEESLINWTKGKVTAQGRSSIVIGKKGLPVTYHSRMATTINKARMESYEIARDRALENIIKTIKSIRVDSDTMLINLISSNILTQKKISEAITHLITFKEYPIDFYSAQCEATIKIGDLIASIPYEFPSHEFPVQDDIPLKTNYSSLIIDGRDLGIQPMLFPSIYTEDGLEIYGRYFVDSRYAARNGLAAYCYNEDEAMEVNRAGDRPYYTTALKSFKGCPVISERDARRILSSNYTINNLKKCKVIIILRQK
jgi:hypothetical protein